MLNPLAENFCRFEPTEKARLVVVIDTEEEFDWSKPVSRSNTSVQAIKSIQRIQSIFDDYGIIPVYAIDYPVASQADGYLPLQEVYADGRCVIGAHLHPWVNPPFNEIVNLRNSFPGNLPKTLEAAKLSVLGDTIGEHFGIRPTVYKAGRFGVGPNTSEVLESLGYEVDVSVRAHANFSDIEGPDFTHHSAWPYWFGSHGQVLELPLTSGFSGIFRPWGVSLHSLATQPLSRIVGARGLMRRFRLFRKLDLTPERSSFSEMQELVKLLFFDGLRVFGLAFHSTSLEAGRTPFVKSDSDLNEFISSCRNFFAWFRDELGGEFSQPAAIRTTLMNRSRGAYGDTGASGGPRTTTDLPRV